MLAAVARRLEAVLVEAVVDSAVIVVAAVAVGGAAGVEVQVVLVLVVVDDSLSVAVRVTGLCVGDCNGGRRGGSGGFGQARFLKVASA